MERERVFCTAVTARGTVCSREAMGKYKGKPMCTQHLSLTMQFPGDGKRLLNRNECQPCMGDQK
jgi:hypothetical protein